MFRNLVLVEDERGRASDPIPAAKSHQASGGVRADGRTQSPRQGLTTRATGGKAILIFRLAFGNVEENGEVGTGDGQPEAPRARVQLQGWGADWPGLRFEQEATEMGCGPPKEGS